MVMGGGRTFPSSSSSSIVSRPTSCPCLLPDTSSSPCSSSRKSSEEPRRVRADGRAGEAGEGLTGSVSGSIMPAVPGRVSCECGINIYEMARRDVDVEHTRDRIT